MGDGYIEGKELGKGAEGKEGSELYLAGRGERGKVGIDGKGDSGVEGVIEGKMGEEEI